MPHRTRGRPSRRCYLHGRPPHRSRQGRGYGHGQAPLPAVPLDQSAALAAQGVGQADATSRMKSSQERATPPPRCTATSPSTPRCTRRSSTPSSFSGRTCRSHLLCCGREKRAYRPCRGLKTASKCPIPRGNRFSSTNGSLYRSYPKGRAVPTTYPQKGQCLLIKRGPRDGQGATLRMAHECQEGAEGFALRRKGRDARRRERPRCQTVAKG